MHLPASAVTALRRNLYLLLIFSSSAAAQPTPMAFAPPAAGITVAADVQYGPSLAMDVYKPPAAAPGAPALVFFNRAVGADRHGRFYDAWARAAASKGIVAILPDLREGSEAADFRVLMSYLAARAGEHGIGAVAVYAASGNAFTALPALEDPALTGVKAAVIYYGGGQVPQFRLDLPVLFVRAGLDRPGMNESMAALVRTAVAQNAPVTLLNHAGGHHGFELADNTAATRDVIEQTLDFVTRALAADYQASLRASLDEATAAGQAATGKFHDAVATYARMVTAAPDNARMRLAYGEALLGDMQYAAACAEFDKLRDKGLGYRDLGLPAAEACLKKGDADAAIAWLKSIPAQFRPASLQNAPAFAALKDRAEFKALFVR